MGVPNFLVDLDGTLAEYDTWKGPGHIGKPVPKMVDRVKRWIKEGRDVRIFTARVSGGHDEWDRSELDFTIHKIEEWCLKHLGTVLPITCCKDLNTIMIFDDRCRQVTQNTGEVVGEQ